MAVIVIPTEGLNETLLGMHLALCLTPYILRRARGEGPDITGLFPPYQRIGNLSPHFKLSIMSMIGGSLKILPLHCLLAATF